MTGQLVAVCFDASGPLRLAQFWAGLLGREVVHDAGGGTFLPGTDTQLGLRFAESRARRVGKNRVHLHLTSASLADQQQTVARALALGAGHVDVGQRPEEGHVVLADPDGNEFGVLTPR
ncbi:VOC family protein [Verrucosispora sp. WMMD573]|uniref:VOC family protein n=1 Tax=Verrucosispora sp. WMMD573 TaxID=3015149 RepID=UPI00248BBBE8|nr:VOC family protein [Verrucosispora sp. WMMD573]WBB53541.1 VOC family protein [Verrucosispora sp. WMMD573]